MYGKDVEYWNRTIGINNPLEEGHFYHTLDCFCELLNDAYAEGIDGQKYEQLCEEMKKRLAPEVFDVFFGFPTRL